MSHVTDHLARLRSTFGYWAGMPAVLDHAIALAREAEYEADRASNLVQAGIAPAYPPLVELLAAVTLGGGEPDA